MIQAIAIDDEPLPLEILTAFCAKVPGILQLARTFTQVAAAQQYLQKFPVDLLFLDIQMPQLSGIEFYRTLPQKAMVIFTSAYSEYALEGFNLSAIDFLLKPFSLERFEAAVQKAQDYYQYTNGGGTLSGKDIFLRAEYSLVKVNTGDILYAESFGDYLTIHLQGGKDLRLRMTLSALLEKLSNTGFARVHRSYVVAVARIEKIRNKTIFIGEAQIPIGANYEAAVRAMIKE